jgi:hypothetical protein
MIASMGATGGRPRPGSGKPRALAFYLPQFHPIPENDEWWGPGFTEWTNVTRARPLYPGHHQPHAPTELGYYDLRVPEVREAQAALAAEHGIAGFVYYHYWFQGRRLLERPFDEVLTSGSPDFPFALCWANEEWTRNWDAKSGQVLMPQEYSEEDDLAHIQWLCTAFADDRYIKIDGRPLMLVYRAGLLPDMQRTAATWRSYAQGQGFPDLYLCWVESHGPPRGEGPAAFGLDAVVGFRPLERPRLFSPADSSRRNRILDYTAAYEAELRRTPPSWKRFPSVMVGWDNAPRRPTGATIFEGATPEAYQRWLTQVVESVSGVREEENYLFIVAWNEWAEGNHLEPDIRYGRGYLEATRAVLMDAPRTGPVRALGNEVATGDAGRTGLGDGLESDRAIVNATELVRELVLEPGSVVVDLGAATTAADKALRDAGVRYFGVGTDAGSVRLLHEAGIDATGCDLSDSESLQSVLQDLGNVSGFMLLDVLGQLVEPQKLLASLSEWALKHGEPALIVSVGNATHFDAGLRLLCDRSTAAPGGLLGGTDVRFFSEATLTRLLERCGWTVVSRNDYAQLPSDREDDELNDALPTELVGALHVLAEACNPATSVTQFVWALRPTPVVDPPGSYPEAVGPPSGREGPETQPDLDAVRRYLESVGIVVSETNRRAAKHLRSGVGPRWKQVFERAIQRSPKAAKAYWRVQQWLR